MILTNRPKSVLAKITHYVQNEEGYVRYMEYCACLPHESVSTDESRVDLAEVMRRNSDAEVVEIELLPPTVAECEEKER